MTAPLKAIDGNADLPALMIELAARARAAARVLALASPEQKNRALDAIAAAIRANAPAILAANAEDVAEVRAAGATCALRRAPDRSRLRRAASALRSTASHCRAPARTPGSDLIWSCLR